MNSMILRTAANYLLPLLLLFSLIELERGHNEPGGGFTGGLIAAAAVTLYAVAHDVATTRKLFRVDPHAIIALGLLVAVAGGLLPAVWGKPFLTGAWTNLAAVGRSDVYLGTPLLFDVGVYLVVTGVTVLIVLTLKEEEDKK
ncbi:MAG: Na+/H+ antiporter subunit B [Rhodopirellula sp.]|nr:Na+/H+ antiporter subunit B [Rhodopirellula sp.]